MNDHIETAPAALLSADGDRKLRRFRVDVGTIIAALVLVQSLLLVGLGYWGSGRLVTTIGESAHNADHARIEDKVNAFLARGVSVVDALAQAPTLEPGGNDTAASAELLWVLLQQAQELDAVYVADDAGHMLMVQRHPEPALREIVRKDGRTTETWSYKPKSPDGLDSRARYATQRVEKRQTDFDPLARSWYQLATTRNGPIWTDPYVFAASQELGVTYARPEIRRGPNGEAVPLVVSGDVTLSRLSDFVRQFSRAGFGDSALLSAQGQVLANSDRPGAITTLAPPVDGVLAAVQTRMLADGSARGTVSTAFALAFDGQRYLVQTSRVPATNWRLISWVPEDKVLGGLRRGVLWALGLVLAFLALILWASLRLARRITAPVERLSRIARLIGRLDLDKLPRVDSRVLEIQQLDQALDDSARGLKAFSKFVPVDIVTRLIDRGHSLEPSGEARELTVMFTDVENFTQIAERAPTDVLVRQITHYFNLAADIVSRRGGTIDKYIGDGMMILWGAPSELPDAEYCACRAALELQAALDALNQQWRDEGLPEFRTRIGIHTGQAITGVLGSHNRLGYTAIGDTVNAASRIEGSNKRLGTRILISETTHAALNGRLASRRVESVVLRGRQAALVLYELLEDGQPLPVVDPSRPAPLSAADGRPLGAARRPDA